MTRRRVFHVKRLLEAWAFHVKRTERIDAWISETGRATSAEGDRISEIRGGQATVAQLPGMRCVGGTRR
ncbi:hypothetical protein GCM10009789_17100 [Kribbella sancticallisti]|uniref:Uncharacterized protein n=1 Tax=Kribbella sancticallisti TaxID=460087 RepID=A0ABP4NSX4_9ACTN